MHVESALLFESAEEVCARVFRSVRPRTQVPTISIEYCRFANANSFIRFQNEALRLRISDILRDAPAPILEALAYILICKLYQKPVPQIYHRRYRLYLNRTDVRAVLQRVRKERGRKLLASPAGRFYNLIDLFEELNGRYFGGLMARPALGWSKRISRTTLGHYDPSHHAIVLSRVLDNDQVARVAVEYVMFHEMLHLRYPVEHRGANRCVHTPAFKQAEKQFELLSQAKEALKKL